MPPLTEEQSERAATNCRQYCSPCHDDDRHGHVNDHALSLRSQSLLEAGFMGWVWLGYPVSRDDTVTADTNSLR